MTNDPQQAAPVSEEESNDSAGGRPRIKIGTQRPGVAAPRVEPRVKFVVGGKEKKEEPSEERADSPVTPQPETAAPAVPPPTPIAAEPPSTEQSTTTAAAPASTSPPESPFKPKPAPIGKPAHEGAAPREIVSPQAHVPRPSLREELPADLLLEVTEALGDMSLDDMISGGEAPSTLPEVIEPDEKRRGRVLRVSKEDVFVDLGGRNQGILPLRQFAQAPAPGAPVEVLVARFDADEGLYELTLPASAVDIGDWSQVREGIVVDARVTGHNKGGLECQVDKLRGFIPIGQIALYRVEDIEQFVGQTLTCVIVEANPERRNLVLSRRAMLEREQAEAKEKLLGELAVGQIREGIVRSLRDFGAFVDLGGVDGLIHVSQMSWDRVQHPSEVLQEGQKVQVKIQKIDPDTKKIGLSYRELLENPWTHASTKYPATSTAAGTVSKIMDFGAFVRLEPGIEGLIHISELAHGRVLRATDVVSEGQEVDVKILSVDPEAQRMSLSLKALQARPMPKKKEQPEEEEPAPPPLVSKRTKPLKGGLKRSSGGDQVGLNW
jgi:predicted RNA-binding protein with RPS1 domain